MTELVWDGKKVGPVRIELPFQTVETVNETAQQRQLTPDRLFPARRRSGAIGLFGVIRSMYCRACCLSLLARST